MLNNRIPLIIVPTRDDVVTPKYAHETDACFDIYTNFEDGNQQVIINPGQTIAIPTGIKVRLPERTCMMIYPRSGISLRTGLRLANGIGIVDQDYRDEIMILLYNSNICDETVSPLNLFKYEDITHSTNSGVESRNNIAYIIPNHTRIAQGMVCPIYKSVITVCDEKLVADTCRSLNFSNGYPESYMFPQEDPNRGGGLGSSGVK